VPAQTPSVFQNGVVAADHPAASEAGAEMLRRGGNVVDAAVATSFALSVARPASCGIGGGGFMVIWNAGRQQAVALDYREKAPAAASREMFANSAGDERHEAGSVRGGKACGVPGTVAGLCFAAKEYGTLPLSVLLEPAIRLAQEGVPVDEHDIGAQAATIAKFRKYPGYLHRFDLLWNQYLNGGVPWKLGDRFYSPQREVLERIAAEGPDGFYQGPVADAMVDQIRQQGGIMTLADLRAMRAVVRTPLHDDYRGHEIYTMPPASSGGVAFIQTLQTLEFWERQTGTQLKSLPHNSADYVHVVSEAMKHAFADRAEYLGDTDFAKVPIPKLISDEYAQQIAAKIDLSKTLPAASYGRFFGKSDAGTSHFSVIDRAGNAVACTETINLTYGSFVVVPQYGILMNNEIDDFAARPGEPNAFGLMQSEANAIAPGKKPLSSMTPTIVLRDGKAIFASGASGGPRIISATIQTVLNHMVYNLAPEQAVTAPRFHHQWFPNELLLEPELQKSIGAELQRRGHVVKPSSSLAAAQAASRSPTGLLGGSDPRKHGVPAGF
jgi:gamma-glutamyltranspeptidase/glutathione hydrolase